MNRYLSFRSQYRSSGTEDFPLGNLDGEFFGNSSISSSHTEAKVDGKNEVCEMPRGVMAIWYGTKSTIPENWVACEGQTINYEDGSSFTVPDMNGRMASIYTSNNVTTNSNSRQYNIGRNEVYGSMTCTLPPHTHTWSFNNLPVTYHYYDEANGNILPSETSNTTTSSPSTSVTESNVPYCTALFYIIRVY